MTHAKETVAICEQGFYTAPSGNVVRIAGDVKRAREGTVLYSPENPPTATQLPREGRTAISVANETAFEAIRRLTAEGGHVACLNFASAKNPGGGFLNGAQAQEEALARASALYPCLLMAPGYYERNRKNNSCIYLDLAIFSPWVPFFRDDEGALLVEPVMASVITAPAPNAGAVSQNEPRNLPLVEPALKRRAHLVLQIAQAHGVEKLVLGAWGCGVFRNDPRMVAAVFAELLGKGGEFERAFAKVAFAVFDSSENLETYRAFASALETTNV